MKLSTLFEILLILIIISFAAETKPVNGKGKGVFNYGVIKTTIIMNVSYYIKYW